MSRVIQTMDWLEKLARQGSHLPYDEGVVGDCFMWTGDNPERALELAGDPTVNGRIRFLLLENLAGLHADDALRALLVELLRNDGLDPWLLGGVPVVIRRVAMDAYREPTRCALRDWLLRAQTAPGAFRYHPLESSALGELCMTFGSFAEAQDANLLFEFVTGPWPERAFITACSAIERTARRHAVDPRVDECFLVHRRALRQRALALANVYHLCQGSGAALASWYDMMFGRLGPEGSMAVSVERRHPLMKSRFPEILRKAEGVLRKRYPENWMTVARARAEGWLDQLGLKKEGVFGSTPSA